MKIKLFQYNYNQTLEEFEKQVNGFMAGVEVVDVKYLAASWGNYQRLQSAPSLLVLYK